MEDLNFSATATASSGLVACREAKLVSKKKDQDGGDEGTTEAAQRNMDVMPARGACDSTASEEHRPRCVSFRPKLDSTASDGDFMIGSAGDEMEMNHAMTDQTSIYGDAMTAASSSLRMNTWDGEVLQHNVSEYWDGKDEDEARTRCPTQPFLDMSKSDTVCPGKASTVRSSLWDEDELRKEDSTVDIDTPFPPPKTTPKTTPSSGTTTGEFVGMVDIAFDQDTGEVVEVFEGQGKAFGVQVGWIIQRIDGVPFSCAQFKRKRDSGAPYRLTFLKRNATDGLGPPGTELTYIPGLFPPTKSRDCTYENVKMGRVCDVSNVSDMCTPNEEQDQQEPPKRQAPGLSL